MDKEESQESNTTNNDGLTMTPASDLTNGNLKQGDDEGDIGEFGDDEEEGDDVDEVDDSCDEEEEDVEPMVVYERMRNEITTICSQRDAISCFAVHYKFIAVGTHCGKIYILDHQGNKVYQNPLLDNATVLQISIDEKGEFIASCCYDRAFIHGLLTRDLDYVFRFDKRVDCVAIDPSFASKSSDRRIVTGDDRELLLHSKNFFAKYTKTLIHSGDGKIRNVKWSPVSRDQYSGKETSFIVFSTDHNVRIFDTSVKAIITVIKKDHDIRLDANLIKCSIHFESSTRLLISWGDSVKIIEIKTRPNDSYHPQSSIHFDRSIVPDPDLPDKYAEIISMFHVNYNIAGISRFKSLDGEISVQTPSNQTPTYHNNILLLVVDKGISIGSTPQFLIMKPESDDALEISCDILSTKGYQHYQCLDYHLESLICDDLYFIVCPKDVISVSPREIDDHISWLIERNRFEEALESIKSYENKLKYSNNSRLKQKKSKYSYLDIGKQFIDHLIFAKGSEDDVIKAAEVMPLICDNNIDVWNEIFDKFENVTRLRTLQPYLPIGVRTPRINSTLRLSQEKYEAVINEFINHDPEGLLSVIEEWSVSVEKPSPNKVTIDTTRHKASFSSLSSLGSPPTSSSFGLSGSGLFSRSKETPNKSPNVTPEVEEVDSASQQPLYDGKKIKQSLLSVLQFKSDSNLLRALAQMYQMESSYDEALKIYLKLGDSKRVFDLISKFDLFDTLRDRLSFFMKLNPIEASKLLMNNQNKISIEEVIEKLKMKPNLQVVYLDQVFNHNPDACADHHDLLITLYVDHDPDKLLNMLKISNHYSLESAFKLVQSKNLISEMVFLLSRMGNNKQALHYITDSLKDIHRAIEFCKEEDDIELWHDLITLSANEPSFIVTLLTNISTYIPDPVMLINSIPDKLIIDDLKSSLISYLDDFRIQINIQEKCKAILVSDCYHLTQSYVDSAKKASNIHHVTKCSSCMNSILPNDLRYSRDVIIFNCNHFFHEDCLSTIDQDVIVCSICHHS